MLNSTCARSLQQSTRHRVEPLPRGAGVISPLSACAASQLYCIPNLPLSLSCSRSCPPPAYSTPWQSTTPAEPLRRCHWTRHAPREQIRLHDNCVILPTLLIFLTTTKYIQQHWPDNDRLQHEHYIRAAKSSTNYPHWSTRSRKRHTNNSHAQAFPTISCN